MSRAVSNRFKTDNNDFLRLESDWTWFRLLLEDAPNGTTSTKNREYNRKFPGYTGPHYE
jgi:hypothetical protein